MKWYLVLGVGVGALLGGLVMGGMLGATLGARQTQIAWKAEQAEWRRLLERSDAHIEELKGEFEHVAEVARSRRDEVIRAKADLDRVQERLDLALAKVGHLSRPDPEKEQRVRLAEALAQQAEARAHAAGESLHRLQGNNPLSVAQIVAVKNAFHDIQHEVAAGNFKGLALTPGYQRLKEIFDNPDMAHVIGESDATRTGR